MRKSAVLLLFLLFAAISVGAQSLDFLGLPAVSFGMKLKNLPDNRLIMDTSSSYSDTALYLKTTRCQMYYQQNQNLQLKGFTASRIEYEFCDSTLGYVFVYVSGKDNISNALNSLKTTFPKMSCGRNVPLGTCSLIDTHNGKMRMIVHIDQVKNEMNFVIIPRHAAR